MINDMKYGIALCVGIIAIVVASSAFADHDKVRVISMKDEYNNRTVYVDNPVRSCRDVDVPIYSQQKGGDDLGAFLGGAIIGGVIGNQIGDSKGNGALGALLGGAIANEKQKKKGSQTIIGYKREHICETTVTKERQIIREYMYSVIKFEYHGRVYSVRFQR